MVIEIIMTLLGIWSGGLNLTEFSETLQSLNLTDGERIVYVDQNGEKEAAIQISNYLEQIKMNHLQICKPSTMRYRSKNQVQSWR